MRPHPDCVVHMLAISDAPRQVSERAFARSRLDGQHSMAVMILLCREASRLRQALPGLLG